MLIAIFLLFLFLSELDLAVHRINDISRARDSTRDEVVRERERLQQLQRAVEDKSAQERENLTEIQKLTEDVCYKRRTKSWLFAVVFAIAVDLFPWPRG